MYQQTTIIGNLGRDPELRYTSAGRAVCDFSVAVSQRWTDRESNEQKEKTTWFRVTCWGPLAESVNQYLSKGRQVLVVGEIDASAWDKDGEPRATLELTAREVKFLGNREDAEPQGRSKPAAADDDKDADIPF